MSTAIAHHRLAEFVAHLAGTGDDVALVALQRAGQLDRSDCDPLEAVASALVALRRGPRPVLAGSSA